MSGIFLRQKFFARSVLVLPFGTQGLFKLSTGNSTRVYNIPTDVVTNGASLTTTIVSASTSGNGTLGVLHMNTNATNNTNVYTYASNTVAVNSAFPAVSLDSGCGNATVGIHWLQNQASARPVYRYTYASHSVVNNASLPASGGAVNSTLGITSYAVCIRGTSINQVYKYVYASDTTPLISGQTFNNNSTADAINNSTVGIYYVNSTITRKFTFATETVGSGTAMGNPIATGSVGSDTTGVWSSGDSVGSTRKYAYASDTFGSGTNVGSAVSIINGTLSNGITGVNV